MAWHIVIVLEGTHIYPELTQDYVLGLAKAEVVINKYPSKARINTPPLDLLGSFVTRSGTLAVLPLSFHIPAFGFSVYSLVLSSAIISAG